jgi:hypothetical protein
MSSNAARVVACRGLSKQCSGQATHERKRRVSVAASRPASAIPGSFIPGIRYLVVVRQSNSKRNDRSQWIKSGSSSYCIMRMVIAAGISRYHVHADLNSKGRSSSRDRLDRCRRSGNMRASAASTPFDCIPARMALSQVAGTPVRQA